MTGNMPCCESRAGKMTPCADVSIRYDVTDQQYGCCGRPLRHFDCSVFCRLTVASRPFKGGQKATFRSSFNGICANSWFLSSGIEHRVGTHRSYSAPHHFKTTSPTSERPKHKLTTDCRSKIQQILGDSHSLNATSKLPKNACVRGVALHQSDASSAPSLPPPPLRSYSAKERSRSLRDAKFRTPNSRPRTATSVRSHPLVRPTSSKPEGGPLALTIKSLRPHGQSEKFSGGETDPPPQAPRPLTTGGLRPHRPRSPPSSHQHRRRIKSAPPRPRTAGGRCRSPQRFFKATATYHRRQMAGSWELEPEDVQAVQALRGSLLRPLLYQRGEEVDSAGGCPFKCRNCFRACLVSEDYVTRHPDTVVSVTDPTGLGRTAGRRLPPQGGSGIRDPYRHVRQALGRSQPVLALMHDDKDRQQKQSESRADEDEGRQDGVDLRGHSRSKDQRSRPRSCYPRVPRPRPVSQLATKHDEDDDEKADADMEDDRGGEKGDGPSLGVEEELSEILQADQFQLQRSSADDQAATSDNVPLSAMTRASVPANHLEEARSSESGEAGTQEEHEHQAETPGAVAGEDVPDTLEQDHEKRQSRNSSDIPNIAVEEAKAEAWKKTRDSSLGRTSPRTRPLVRRSADAEETAQVEHVEKGGEAERGSVGQMHAILEEKTSACVSSIVDAVEGSVCDSALVVSQVSTNANARKASTSSCVDPQVGWSKTHQGTGRCATNSSRNAVPECGHPTRSVETSTQKTGLLSPRRKSQAYSAGDEPTATRICIATTQALHARRPPRPVNRSRGIEVPLQQEEAMTFERVPTPAPPRSRPPRPLLRPKRVKMVLPSLPDAANEDARGRVGSLLVTSAQSKGEQDDQHCPNTPDDVSRRDDVTTQNATVGKKSSGAASTHITHAQRPRSRLPRLVMLMRMKSCDANKNNNSSAQSESFLRDDQDSGFSLKGYGCEGNFDGSYGYGIEEDIVEEIEGCNDGVDDDINEEIEEKIEGDIEEEHVDERESVVDEVIEEEIEEECDEGGDDDIDDKVKENTELGIRRATDLKTNAKSKEQCDDKLEDNVNKNDNEPFEKGRHEENDGEGKLQREENDDDENGTEDVVVDFGDDLKDNVADECEEESDDDLGENETDSGGDDVNAGKADDSRDWSSEGTYEESTSSSTTHCDENDNTSDDGASVRSCSQFGKDGNSRGAKSLNNRKTGLNKTSNSGTSKRSRSSQKDGRHVTRKSTNQRPARDSTSPGEEKTRLMGQGGRIFVRRRRHRDSTDDCDGDDDDDDDVKSDVSCHREQGRRAKAFLGQTGGKTKVLRSGERRKIKSRVTAGEADQEQYRAKSSSSGKDEDRRDEGDEDDSSFSRQSSVIEESDASDTETLTNLSNEEDSEDADKSRPSTNKNTSDNGQEDDDDENVSSGTDGDETDECKANAYNGHEGKHSGGSDESDSVIDGDDDEEKAEEEDEDEDKEDDDQSESDSAEDNKHHRSDVSDHVSDEREDDSEDDDQSDENDYREGKDNEKNNHDKNDNDSDDADEVDNTSEDDDDDDAGAHDENKEDDNESDDEDNSADDSDEDDNDTEDHDEEDDDD